VPSDDVVTASYGAYGRVPEEWKFVHDVAESAAHFAYRVTLADPIANVCAGSYDVPEPSAIVFQPENA
jgi:hypothetical protein